ncbi:L,D-transpeptidase [Anaerolineales bacterium HSG6]|nr:L,D-transpeptidase [Anaerolineales bacterium HSG6]MDM8532565.1 L,D-transpeptidase [Anaerolineales bacterium HSG25]
MTLPHLKHVLSSVLLGLLLTLSAMTSIAIAQSPVGSTDTSAKIDSPPANEPFYRPAQVATNSITALPYARVMTDDAPVYRLVHGTSPTITYRRKLTRGFYFVSLEQVIPISHAGVSLYKINANEYVRIEHINPVTPSQFAGIEIIRQPEQAFGWVIRDTPILSAPSMVETEQTQYLKRYSMITIYETKYSGEWGWHRIGDNQWVALYDTGKVSLKPRPANVPAGERWVEVDLFEQTFAAYDEQDRMIYATLIASGRQVDGWRTPPGLFYIKSARINGKMAGGGMNDYYYLEDVRATMFFTESYAFHAAYWHDDFGRYKSHGCVNMSPVDADWMFNWAASGITAVEKRVSLPDDAPRTWVWVHRGLLDQITQSNSQTTAGSP